MILATIEQIDALLPQTQCQLCEFDGCKPYAAAIANKEAPINRCLPGGVAVLQQLADLLQQDPSPYLKEMELKTKSPTQVVIREEICIGCTKCIDACPTDAILGSGKKMHTVIADLCTGCELCLPPCPVDCIDILPARAITSNQSILWRTRHEEKKQRLLRLEEEAEDRYQKKLSSGNNQTSVIDRQKAMATALERVKNKKKE